MVRRFDTRQSQASQLGGFRIAVSHGRAATSRGLCSRSVFLASVTVREFRTRNDHERLPHCIKRSSRCRHRVQLAGTRQSRECSELSEPLGSSLAHPAPLVPSWCRDMRLERDHGQVCTRALHMTIISRITSTYSKPRTFNSISSTVLSTVTFKMYGSVSLVRRGHVIVWYAAIYKWRTSEGGKQELSRVFLTFDTIVHSAYDCLIINRFTIIIIQVYFDWV